MRRQIPTLRAPRAVGRARPENAPVDVRRAPGGRLGTWERPATSVRQSIWKARSVAKAVKPSGWVREMPRQSRYEHR